VHDPCLLLLDASPTSEWWNFALGALELLLSGAVLAVAGNIYSHRRQREEAVDRRFTTLEEKVERNKERLGSEIGDVKVAVAPLFNKVDLPNPSYPTR
jgi:hypothetical protein